MVNIVTEKKEMLSLIVENANEAVVSVDRNGRIIYVNKATEKIFGWKAEELIGKHFSIFAIDKEKQRRQFEEAIKKGGLRIETVRKDKYGNEVPVLMTVLPFKDENGNLLFSTAILVDIRELKEYERRIKHLNDVLKAIRNINQLITKEKNIERILKRACDILVKVRKYESICIVHEEKIFMAGDKKKCKKLMEFINKNRDKIEKEREIFEKINGGYVFGIYFSNEICISLYALHSEKFDKEEMDLLREVCEDIRFAIHSIKIQESLEEEKQLMKAILSASPVGIGYTINRILGWANDAMYKMTGYTPEETLGKSARILYESDEEYERVGKEIEKAVRKGKIAEIETKWKRKDGSVFDCYLRVYPINPKKPDEVVVVAMDITERKRLMKSLEESEEKYRVLAENAPVGVFIVYGREVIYLNKKTEEMLKREENAKHLYDIWKRTGRIPIEAFFDIWKKREKRKKVISIFEKTLEHKGTHTIELKTGGGRYLLLRIANIKYGEDKALLGIVEDITELREMEKKLRESEARFRSLVENADDAIYTINPEGFEYINPAFEKLTGYSKKEILSEEFNFWKLIHPGDRKLIEERKEAREKGKEIKGRYEFRIITKDGRIRFVEASTVPLGRKRVLGILRDITERKKAEELVSKLSELHYIIGMSINRSNTIKELCHNILKNIKEIIEIDYTNIFVYDREKHVLKPIIYYGYPEDFVERVMKKYKISEDSPWEAVKTFLQKKERYVKDIKRYKPLSFNWDIYKKYDAKELYSIPLITENKVYGVLQVLNTSKNLLTDEKKKLLKSIAEEIAAGIAKIEAQERMKRALEQEREFKLKTAHYFFNPICIAKGYLQLAMEEGDGKDKIMKAMEAIKRVERVIKNITQRGEITE